MSDKAILANVEVIMVNRKRSIGTDKSDIEEQIFLKGKISYAKSQCSGNIETF
jgi:hypothetical protein